MQSCVRFHCTLLHSYGFYAMLVNDDELPPESSSLFFYNISERSPARDDAALVKWHGWGAVQSTENDQTLNVWSGGIGTVYWYMNRHLPNHRDGVFHQKVKKNHFNSVDYNTITHVKFWRKKIIHRYLNNLINYTKITISYSYYHLFWMIKFLYLIFFYIVYCSVANFHKILIIKFDFFIIFFQWNFIILIYFMKSF